MSHLSKKSVKLRLDPVNSVEQCGTSDDLRWFNQLIVVRILVQEWQKYGFASCFIGSCSFSICSKGNIPHDILL